MDAADCQAEQADCQAEVDRLSAEHEESVAGQRQIGWIITGAGGAFLLGAIIHDAVSQSTIDDYEEAAVNGNRPDYDSLADDIDSATTISWVLYGLGTAGIITGVIVAVTAGGGHPADDMDCDDLCWNWGVGIGSAEVGFRF